MCPGDNSMKLRHSRTFSTDVLVIGGGGGGLRAAIEARECGARAMIVSQSRVGYGSNTAISGGAFAAVRARGSGKIDSEDTIEQHRDDTLEGGRGISDWFLVEMLVGGAEQQIDDLYRFGVRYANEETDSWIPVVFDPGHSRRRMIYGRRLFGTDFTFPLREYAAGIGVEFVEGVLITSLVKEGEHCVGAIGVTGEGMVCSFTAPATILATGGLGQAFMINDNTVGSTGDGYVLAYEAGVTLRDMEFVQFYPTALKNGRPAIYYECLIPDAGGKVLNWTDEDVAARYGLTDYMAFTRDRLSIAIAREISEGRGYDNKVILDLSAIPKETMAFLSPILPKEVHQGQLRFMITPTAHTFLGGVQIDTNCATNVPGLYGAGEACGGVQGANRLSGNALTELWVFGAIAGRNAAAHAQREKTAAHPDDTVNTEIERLQAITSDGGEESVKSIHESLKTIMWTGVGVLRNEQGLEKARGQLIELGERLKYISANDEGRLPRVIKMKNMLVVSEMVCNAALMRKESRGCHFREDFPEREEERWKTSITIAKDGETMVLDVV